MTEVPARLSIVTLGVRNMGVLRSFYRALGWRELPISQGPAGWSGVTLACTVSTREEVDTAFAAALAAGATPVADATDRSWGGRSGSLPIPRAARCCLGAEPGLRSGVRYWQPIGLAACKNECGLHVLRRRSDPALTGE
jgi:uncharacterized protein